MSDKNRALQEWMLKTITNPQGVAVGTAIETTVRPSATLSEVERLNVYHVAYFERLLQVFETEYPALTHLLGNELLRHFGLTYLQDHPPKSYTLQELTADFPAFLERTSPAAPDAPASWEHLILEIAKVERLFSQVFCGPGFENEPEHHLAPGEIANAYQLNPSLHPLSLQFPVHEYIAAVRRGELPDLPAPRKCYVLMYRKNWSVKFLEVSKHQFNLLHSKAQLPAQLEQHPDWRASWERETILRPLNSININISEK